MKPSPILLPPPLLRRLPPEQAPQQWMGVGNPALLEGPLLGLLVSRQCPSHAMLQTIDRIPQWVAEGRIILSGFHSPLEQQTLRSLLRRKGRAVKLLARGLSTHSTYRVPLATPEEAPALNDDRLLVISPFPPKTRRTTRATSLHRNRLLLALVTEAVVPHKTKDSPLAALLEEQEGLKIISL